MNLSRIRFTFAVCTNLTYEVLEHNTLSVSGAGFHSDSLRKDYQKTCYAACRRAAEALARGENAVDAVEKAIIGL